MTDREFIYAFDLDGKDRVLTISKVAAGELTAGGGKKAKKPIVHFDGKEKGLALNATNAKTIAALYGNYTEKWIGREITLYPTTTQMGGETVECIRVRPAIPKKNGKKSSEPEPDLTEQIREQMNQDANEVLP